MSRLKRILDGTQIDDALIGAVRTQAPNIAAALAGAGGGPLAAGVARQVATRVLGEPDAPPERVAEMLAAGGLAPDQRAKLMQIEGEQSVALAGIAADDRADARAREVATNGGRALMAFAATIFAAFCGYTVLLVVFEVPEGSQSIVFGAGGTLGAALMAVVGYYFGSSVGSKSKEAGMLARMR